ncbi:hypothetical protein [Pandoraea sputorum]|uniref:hypothetical protein n=1 Tax=Pandoraea sputorum TaxID=93222 RepID=UPI002F42A5A2
MATPDANEDVHEAFNDALLIEARPEIQVFLAKNGQISITSKTFSESSEAVETDIVSIPLDCAEDVAKALVRIAQNHG